MKLSSPYLNTLIILGVILFYIDVILFGIDKNVAPENIVDVNCQVRSSSNEVNYFDDFLPQCIVSRLQYGWLRLDSLCCLEQCWQRPGGSTTSSGMSNSRKRLLTLFDDLYLRSKSVKVVVRKNI